MTTPPVLTPQIAQLLNVDALKKELAERSLYEFVQQAWSVIDPVSFVDAKHIEVICSQLERCYRRDVQKLCINVPPGHSKSMLCAVMFPAWIWIRSPHERFICASHSLAQATKHSVLCRELIESAWYQQRWGDRFRLAADQNQKTAFKNDKGGHRNIASPGNATGDSAEFMIVDDPHEIGDVSPDSLLRVAEWFDRTLCSRIRDPQRGVRIVIGQRVAQNDLTGHVIEDGGYTHLCLPAEYEPNHPSTTELDWRTSEGELLWPERYDSAFMDEEKKRLGSLAFATLHQQRPSAVGGNIIKEAWPRYYTTLPGDFDTRVISVDATFKESKDADYVVVQCWGRKGADYYLIDQIRGKWDFVTTISQLKSFIAKHPRATTRLIEDKANGPAIISSLKHEISGLIPVNPKSSKEARLASTQPLWEAGNVYLPQNAPWLDAYVAELTTFPTAAHDDQVDATSQALSRLSSNTGFNSFSYI